MKPWVCPKCGRVWSGMVTQCLPCNQKVGRADAANDMHRRRMQLTEWVKSL